MATFISNKENFNTIINLDLCEVIELYGNTIYFYFNYSNDWCKSWSFVSQSEAGRIYTELQSYQTHN